MVSKQDVSILLPYLGFQSLALNVILIFLTLHIQEIHTIQCHRLYHLYLMHRFQPKKLTIRVVCCYAVKLHSYVNRPL